VRHGPSPGLPVRDRPGPRTCTRQVLALPVSGPGGVAHFRDRTAERDPRGPWRTRPRHPGRRPPLPRCPCAPPAPPVACAHTAHPAVCARAQEDFVVHDGADRAGRCADRSRVSARSGCSGVAEFPMSSPAPVTRQLHKITGLSGLTGAHLLEPARSASGTDPSLRSARARRKSPLCVFSRWAAFRPSATRRRI